MTHRIGVYPGTFDPITLGHMDIIRRGAKLVDELIIGVTTNAAKSPMFSDDERIAMVEREVASIGSAHIRVVGFNSLLMDFAEAHGASTVIRGIRRHGLPVRRQPQPSRPLRVLRLRAGPHRRH